MCYRCSNFFSSRRRKQLKIAIAVYLFEIQEELLDERPPLEVPEVPLALSEDLDRRLDLETHRLLDTSDYQIHCNRHELLRVFGGFDVQRFKGGFGGVPRRRNERVISLR